MKLSQTFLAGVLLLSLCPSHSQAQTATVSWNKVDQVIDGFGASDAFASRPLTSAEATLFFSPTSGIGLSLLRTAVPSDGSCSTVTAACAGQVSDMQLAIANGARIWSTPFSPPAAMKSNGSLDNGGSLLVGSYGDYAAYLANYVKSLRTFNNINLYALSVQNEPEMNAAYSSAIWTPASISAFVGTDLGPTFAADALPSVIILPETAMPADLPQFASTTMSDPTAAAYVGIMATHGYNFVSPAYPQGQPGGKHLWETEISDSNPFDPSMTSALKYAQLINDWMTVANANAWHYWRLVELYAGNNEGLTDMSGTPTKRMYMMGNYSKFVRPGFYRIDATPKPQSNVSISAYKNASTGALVLVVVNQNTSSILQSFTLSGATISSVTPWITSASLNLAQQPTVSATAGSFSYTLPASSVTTFVGQIVGSPPAGLTATVR